MQHDHRNIDWTNIFVFAVLGAGIYVASKLWKKGEETTDALSKFIAASYIKFTLPEPVGVKGAAILENGAQIQMSQVNVKKVPNQEIFYFDYLGKRYQLGSRSAQGNWPAKQIS